MGRGHPEVQVRQGCPGFQEDLADQVHQAHPAVRVLQGCPDCREDLADQVRPVDPDRRLMLILELKKAGL
ncbi:MAG: hypothetical protein OXC95_12680 [Dehalococcoidia bacterium]|nr:hypothetical protein [Dehalococcoidia bacterium]